MRMEKKSLESSGHIEKVREPILELGEGRDCVGSQRQSVHVDYVLESSGLEVPRGLPSGSLHQMSTAQASRLFICFITFILIIIVMQGRYLLLLAYVW